MGCIPSKNCYWSNKSSSGFKRNFFSILFSSIQKKNAIVINQIVIQIKMGEKAKGNILKNLQCTF